MSISEKVSYIRKLRKENLIVFSEVGSKDVDAVVAPYKWIKSIKEELNAGAYKVIAEARESGTVGIYRRSGEIRMGLIDEVVHEIPFEKLIFEAPQKSQQVWFIKKFGANVNLGNILPQEVIPLETLRVGLRGDTLKKFHIKKDN
jgi:phosphosulfolactate synthase